MQKLQGIIKLVHMPGSRPEGPALRSPRRQAGNTLRYELHQRVDPALAFLTAAAASTTRAACAPSKVIGRAVLIRICLQETLDWLDRYLGPVKKRE